MKAFKFVLLIFVLVLIIGCSTSNNGIKLKNMKQTTSDVMSKIKEQITADLERSKEILFVPNSKIEIRSGSNFIESFGIMNTGESILNYQILFEDSEGNCGELFGRSALGDCPAIAYDNTPRELSPGETSVETVKIFAPEGKELFLIKLSVIDADKDKVIADKSLFLTII